MGIWVSTGLRAPTRLPGSPSLDGIGPAGDPSRNLDGGYRDLDAVFTAGDLQCKPDGQRQPTPTLNHVTPPPHRSASRFGASDQRIALRLWVRLHRWRLDRELAGGCRADASEAHALRARQLSRPRSRRQLARSLRRVAAEAEKPRGPQLGSVIPVRRDLTPWTEALLGLAERLERPASISTCALARVSELLTDGTGPLYGHDPRRTIADAVWGIADVMRGCPPHAWGCPVIMKLDPEHVAWTCGRCGAIATTGDPAVRPA